MSQEQEEVQDRSAEAAPADEPEAAPESASSPEAPPAPAAEPAPATDAKDVEEGRVFAVLSYALGLVGIPFFLVPLIMRNNEFSLYHAKQCLVLALLFLARGVLVSMMAVTVILLFLAPLVWLATCVVLWVGCIMGLMAASKGEMKPLPVIGRWAEDWFKGFQEV